MKRSLLLPLIVLALVSMACSLFTPDNPTIPTEPAQQVQAQPTKVEAQAEEIIPTEEPVVPTETTAPTEEPVVAEPTEPEPTATEVKPAGYEDTFEKRNKDWSDPLFVTTQASGRDPYTKITVDGGVMHFSITDLETYVYKFNQNTLDGDVTFEIEYHSKGSLNNGIAVVCKANAEHTEWFEVRITSYDSQVNFYHYDKNLKIEENKNPYVQLGKTHLDVKELAPSKPNTFKVTCTDSQILVDINNGKKTTSVDLETTLDGNNFGLGAMSYDVLPVIIDFDSVKVAPAE